MIGIYLGIPVGIKSFENTLPSTYLIYSLILNKLSFVLYY